MLQKIALCFLLCSFFFITVPVSGEEFFTSLIGEDNYSKLLEKGEVTSVFTRGGAPSLAPFTCNRAALEEEVALSDPVIGVEMLMVLERPWVNFSSPPRKLQLYNILHDISTLKRIEYYSQSRGRMRIFFHDAYVIDNPDNKRPLPDPVFTSIQPENQLFAFISDSSFGKYIGDLRYTYAEDCFSMDIRNDSRIYYGILPAASPGGLKIYLSIVPREDKILFYGLTCVNTVNFFGLATKKVPSFLNRLRAMFGWFESQVDQLPAP